MLHLSAADLLGWAGVTMGVISTWIQYRRARSISVDGISLVTWLQFILMGIFWISYGAERHSLIIAAGAAFVMPMQISIVARLKPWRHGANVMRAVAFIFACSAAPTLLLGWQAGVYGIGVAMALNRVPQIMTLVRNRGDLGVSVGSWSLGAVCSANVDRLLRGTRQLGWTDCDRRRHGGQHRDRGIGFVATPPTRGRRGGFCHLVTRQLVRPLTR